MRMQGVYYSARSSEGLQNSKQLYVRLGPMWVCGVGYRYDKFIILYTVIPSAYKLTINYLSTNYNYIKKNNKGPSFL